MFKRFVLENCADRVTEIMNEFHDNVAYGVEIDMMRMLEVNQVVGDTALMPSCPECRCYSYPPALSKSHCDLLCCRHAAAGASEDAAANLGSGYHESARAGGDPRFRHHITISFDLWRAHPWQLREADEYAIPKSKVHARLVSLPLCEEVTKPNVSCIRNSDIEAFISLPGTVIRTGAVKTL